MHSSKLWKLFNICTCSPSLPFFHGAQNKSTVLMIHSGSLAWSPCWARLVEIPSRSVSLVGLSQSQYNGEGFKHWPFAFQSILPLCGKPHAALRTFPRSVSVPTAHSGVRLDENDTEAPLLLCQKKKGSRSRDSKRSYSDSSWAALNVNTEGTYLDDSHSKVHMLLC